MRSSEGGSSDESHEWRYFFVRVRPSSVFDSSASLRAEWNSAPGSYSSLGRAFFLVISLVSNG